MALHLRGGRDHFLSVDAEFVPSSFGQSLVDLVERNGLPVRAEPPPLIDLVRIFLQTELWSRNSGFWL